MMIAAMATAVSAVSTLRLVSGPAGLAGKSAFVDGGGPLGERGAGTGVDAGAIGLNGTG
jgi:hypothetical protein